MTNELKVIARFKDSSGENPKFSSTVSLEELLLKINKNHIPVDIVYGIYPTNDGGYVMSPLGTLVIQLIPFTADQLKAPPTQDINQAKITQPESNKEVLNEAPKMESIVESGQASKGDSPTAPTDKKNRRRVVLLGEDEVGAETKPLVSN